MKQYNDLFSAIHKEGHIFVLIFAAVTAVLYSIGTSFGLIGLMATIWCAFFFRDPNRFTPVEEGLLISPADGVIQRITDATPPAELGMGEEEMTRISVFLNVFNVHVNRMPAEGKITKLHYHPGKFFNASLDKASIHNERQSILMETNTGQNIAFVQIAGLIARRIVCDLEEGNELKAGERFGIIRFGSRVDVYIPKGITPIICEGQTVIAGETIFADLNAKKVKQTEFEVR